jgi:signal transduction histidine kinase
MAIERNIDLIFSNQLFENCSSSRISGYNLSNRNFSEYKEGDVIFQAGDSSNFIYLVISGSVKLKFRSNNRVILKSGKNFFGDFEIIRGTNRSSSAVAISDCVLYRIDKDVIKRFMSIEDQIVANIKSSEESYLKETEDSKPKADISSVLNLDRSPIKLDIFKRKNKEQQTIAKQEENPEEQKTDEIANRKSESLPEIPDLESVIEQTAKKIAPDDSLKKELLGDAEDFDSWNFSTVESPSSEIEEKIEFESQKPLYDEKEIEEKIAARYDKKLEDTKKDLARNHDALVQSLLKLTPSLTVSETVEKVISVFTKHFNANYVYLFLVNEKTTDLELVYPDSAKPLIAPYNDGLTGRAAATKRMITLRNPAKDFRFNSRFDKPKDFTEGSVVYVPLNDSENKLIGVIQLGRIMKDFSKENEATLSILANQSGKIIQQSTLNEDKLRFEKLSAFGSISRFLMNDIKSPILTIKHYSNLISRIDVPDQIKKVLTMLSMQANSVVDIMQSTFDFSENSSSLKLQKTQFNEIMKNILELLSEYTESRNVKLFKKFGSEANANIDPRRFYVVCFQIVKNACEAMPNGGRIFVNTDVINKSVILNIRDEGSGINPEVGEDLYNTFFTRGKENATGLGLSVSKFIIERMNGSISYDSKPNEGTTFTISLPVVE